MAGTCCCQRRWNPSTKDRCVDLAGSGQNRHSIYRVHTTWHFRLGPGSEQGGQQLEPAAFETSSPSPERKQIRKTRSAFCHCLRRVASFPQTGKLTHSLEREVALKDHFPDLCEDGVLGVGQIHLPDASVSHAALVLLLGFLCLSRAEQM